MFDAKLHKLQKLLAELIRLSKNVVIHGGSKHGIAILAAT